MDDCLTHDVAYHDVPGNMVTMQMQALRSTISLWYVRVLLGVCIVVVGLTFFVGVSLVLPYQLVNMIVLIGVVGGLGATVELTRTGGSVHAFGISFHRQTLTLFAWGVGIALVMLSIIGALAIMMGATFQLQEYAGLDPLVYRITELFLGATAEEVMFRGTIMLALAARFGNRIAIVTTSVVFSIGHIWNPGGVEVLAVVNVFMAGVLLGSMALEKASLTIAIGFHAAWNVVVSLLFGNVSGQTHSVAYSVMSTNTISPDLVWLISGPFGIEQGLFTTCMLLVGIVYLYRSSLYDAVVAAARIRTLIAERQPTATSS
jgi:membrane protease YdiL (CAAX protease family)